LIFAGGSLARGAPWAAELDGKLEVYSDIDLYVVVEDVAFMDGVRAAVRAAIRQEEVEEGGVRFLRGVDAGVYTREDLRAQPVRPGTADLGSRHLLLHGDEKAVQALLARPQAMLPGEALYLLENRAWDAWRTDDSDPARARLSRVMSLKLDLDIAAACMIVDGADAASVSDPASMLRAGSLPGLDPAVRDAGLRAADARDDLGVFLQNARDEEPCMARVCRAWLALAPRVMNDTGAGAAALLARRCRVGKRADNLREFVRVAGCVGISRVGALAHAAGCSARSPRAALRLHPLARAFAESGGEEVAREHIAYVERVTSALGFVTGPLDDRVRAAHVAIS
jgi:hypothetical protein